MSDYRIVTDRRKKLENRIAELKAKVKQLQTVTPESCSVLEAENQRLKDALVKANNNQMVAAQCASDFKYGYEKRGKEIAELEAKLDAY